MASRLDFNFYQTFPGSVWNTLSVPNTDLLIIEVRNDDKREASFSALDFKHNRFLWKDKIFEENWWIGLTAATSDVLLLHLFQSMDNPDEKGLMAWHIHEQKLLWKLDHFSFDFMDDKCLYGFFSEDDSGIKAVDTLTGRILENVEPSYTFKENIMLQKPFQYIDGNPHFETVKSFITSKLKAIPTIGVEYLEFAHHIFISFQVQEESLANYLVVFNHEGELVLQEKLDDHLKGIGLDTFFVLSGCLFFVKNKRELISYRIV